MVKIVLPKNASKEKVNKIISSIIYRESHPTYRPQAPSWMTPKEKKIFETATRNVNRSTRIAAQMKLREIYARRKAYLIAQQRKRLKKKRKTANIKRLKKLKSKRMNDVGGLYW